MAIMKFFSIELLRSSISAQPVYRNLEAIKSTEDESFLLSGILFYYEPSGQAF